MEEDEEEDEDEQGNSPELPRVGEPAPPLPLVVGTAEFWSISRNAWHSLSRKPGKEVIDDQKMVIGGENRK